MTQEKPTSNAAVNRPSEEGTVSIDAKPINHIPKWTLGILNDRSTVEVPGKDLVYTGKQPSS